MPNLPHSRSAGRTDPGGTPAERAGRIAGPRTLLGAAAVVIVVLAPTLLFPYGRDQSVFAYVGSVMARGGMPYAAAWDLKPPGIYLLYALLARACGEHAEAMMGCVRVADLSIAALVGILIALLARRWGRSEVGCAAAAWYAALYLHGTFWSLAQAEAWANLPVLAAALLSLRAAASEKGRVSLLFGIGLLAGAALLLKPTTVLPVLPFAVVAVCAGGRGRSTLHALLILLGGMLPLLLAGAWLAAGGAWDAFMDIQRGFVEPYTRLNAASVGTRIANLFAYTLPWMLGAWLPVLLCAAALLARSREVSQGNGESGSRREGALIGAALLAGLIAVWAQNKYFGYHWQTALPWLALLSAAGGARLLRSARIPERALPAAGVALAVAWSVGSHWDIYRDAPLHVAGLRTRAEWLARFRTGRDFSFAGNAQVAEYVASTTRPGAGLLVWGFEPAVYLLAERRPPTRFFFNVPVAAPFTPEAWRREFLDDLRRRPPELFLVVRNDAIPWASGRRTDSVAQLQAWPELRRWLGAHYRLETRVEDFSVYRWIGRAEEVEGA